MSPRLYKGGYESKGWVMEAASTAVESIMVDSPPALTQAGTKVEALEGTLRIVISIRTFSWVCFERFCLSLITDPCSPDPKPIFRNHFMGFWAMGLCLCQSCRNRVQVRS